MFVIINKLPYYISDDYTHIFGCEVSATEVRVDSSAKYKVETQPSHMYTLDELRRSCSIFLVDGWDKVNQKVIKVSNTAMSSIGINPYKSVAKPKEQASSKE